MDKFFARLAEDLETYAAHAKRKTIEVEDVKLLLRRQGYINDKQAALFVRRDYGELPVVEPLANNNRRPRSANVLIGPHIKGATCFHLVFTDAGGRQD
ncbi:hypothetical protein ATANTOWER_007865 [Ataeniobius toweri]|uniref:CENP-T/Histone H4 histone fold domain-containing protein n=1 Tax=Ataeniobius toweri TaxID=208326 RepID=A0ABU7A5L5_9TELE|nr:hypothetical protein [Ataeniobius toweri]